MFLVAALRGLLPARCLACGLPEAWPCCGGCLPVAPGAVGPWALAADPDLPVWTLGPYRDALRAAVLAGKLDGQLAALTELGRRLGTALAAAGAGADLVTYVAAGRVAGPPRDRALGRARGAHPGRARHPGTGFPSGARHPGTDPAGRAWLDRAPPARPPPRARRRLAGGRVLLVDDLTTTGGTLAAAAATLRLAGARQVEAAVLAASPAAVRPDPGRAVPPPAPAASARRS